jgi:zinc transport system permease protein
MFITKLFSFFEAWALFSMPTLSSIFTGALLGLLGTYLVLRKMVFLNIAMTQAATFGIVFSFLMQTWIVGNAHEVTGVSLFFKDYLFNPSFFSALFTFFTLFLIDQNNQRLNRESRIAIAFILFHALSIAMHSLIKQDPHEIERLLMGSAVLVVDQDYQRMQISLIVILLSQILFWRGFVKLSFDPTSAHIQGLPGTFLNIFLLLQIAWATGISTQMIGSLPSFALSILPVLAAKQNSQQIKHTLIYSSVFGALSGGMGYIMAFIYDISVGAAQSIVVSLILLICLVVRYLRGFWH